LAPVNSVVPKDQLDVDVKKWCDEILEKIPTAIELAKKSFNIDTEIIRGIGGLAMHALKLYYETPESADGGDAFREKRKPTFHERVKLQLRTVVRSVTSLNSTIPSMTAPEPPQPKTGNLRFFASSFIPFWMAPSIASYDLLT